jgi:chromosome partitioning protein
MAKVIAISNHKGGVGKTTSVVNIGAGLSYMGEKVLLIDLDPQSNLSVSFGIEDAEYNIYGAIRGDYQLKIINIIPNLDLIPSTLDLSGAEIELSGEAGREYILEELIEPIISKYDYVFIDCPPSLGLLTINALSAADEVYIPIQAQFLAIKGLAKISEVIDKIKKRINKKLQIGGVLITQYDHRKILNRDVAETIENHFENKVFRTKIRDNVAIAEAPCEGVDIFRYSPRCYGSEDYLSLCKEIIAKK